MYICIYDICIYVFVSVYIYIYIYIYIYTHKVMTFPQSEFLLHEVGAATNVTVRLPEKESPNISRPGDRFSVREVSLRPIRKLRIRKLRNADSRFYYGSSWT